MSSLYGSVAMLLILIAAEFSSRKSLLRLSWPGIGLTTAKAAAPGEGLGGGQPARLGHDHVGGGQQFVHLGGEAQHVQAVAGGNGDRFQFRFQLLVAPGYDHHFQRFFQRENAGQELRHRPDAESAGQLQHDGPIAQEIVPRKAQSAVFMLRIDRILMLAIDAWFNSWIQ